MKRKTNFPSVFFKGLLVGSIAASVFALFNAPQSGTETRRMLKDKSEQMRDEVSHTINNAQKKVNKVMASTRKRTDRILRRVNSFEKEHLRPLIRNAH